jgi:hypothetical protein
VIVEVLCYSLELFVALLALESRGFAILFAIEFAKCFVNLPMRFEAFS